MSIGSFHSCSVDVADLNDTFELPAFACLIDVNNAQSRRAASRSMWAAAQGIGSPERDKNPIFGGEISARSGVGCSLDGCSRVIVFTCLSEEVSKTSATHLFDT